MTIHLVNHQNVMMERNDAEHSGDSCCNKKTNNDIVTTTNTDGTIYCIVSNISIFTVYDVLW